MLKKILLSVIFLAPLVIIAQVSDAEKSQALDLVTKNKQSIGLADPDISQSLVTGTYIIPGSDIRMVYLQQSYRDIPVYNRLHVLAFRDEKIVSVAGSRVPSLQSRINSNGTPVYNALQAVEKALQDIGQPAREAIVPVHITKDGQRFEFGSLGVSTENIYAELLWFPVNEDQHIRLAWQVFAAPQNSSSYWLIRVDAMTNEVFSKEDMTISCNWGPEGSAHDHKNIQRETGHIAAIQKTTQTPNPGGQYLINTATYRVVKYPAESPIHPGGAPSLHTDPWLLSPGNATTLGWHNDGVNDYDSTRGNNVFAYDDRDANNLPGRSGVSTTPLPNITMNFVPDFSLEPTVRTPAPNQQFNTTNLFYWNNLIHDLSYIYGFTETARNYQNNNMGRGGVAGDYVLAEAQDGSGTNNANFSPGADGSRGRMQMYLWTAPTPDRDGDVDNGIIAHEYTHGISNRMTGTGAGCLNVVEQMGEGWSDYFGLMITHDWANASINDGFDKPRGIGTYALNQAITGPGIRQYRYTTNMAVNPMTYGNLPSVAVPHGVGTIWCTALWDMTWYIIQQAGINPNIYNPAAGGGNAIALKLVMEGLRLQPCGPGFIDGRNAILKADTLFFGAQYSCAILEAFARRGMGIGASQGSPSVRGDETLSFNNGKPVISTQPTDASVCTGSNHTFSVSATGVNLSYQWQLSTDGGSNYNNISGATNPSYTVTGVTIAMNNYRYRCIVSGCPPSVTSNAAQLSVTSAPVLNSSPSDLTVCAGANASFTVSASGTGLNYQWQVSTDGGANYSNIAGATASTLNLTAVTGAMNNNRYRCVLTNSCPVPVPSAAAILTVNAQTVISTQPVSTTICAGSTHTLSVSAAGTSLTYIWETSSSCSGPWTAAGSSSASLTVTPAGTRYYRCRVSGVCGSEQVTSCASVTVISPVSISAQPTSNELCSGGNAQFSITAGSSETISYQWQLSAAGGPFTNIPGAVSNSYSVNNVTTAMSGNMYRCLLSTASCSSPVISTAAGLTVRQLPSVTLSAAPLTSLLPGQTTTLTAVTSPSTGGLMSTSWLLNNSPLTNNGLTRIVNVEQVGTYRVNVQETFPGGLQCTATSSTVVIDAAISDKLFIFPSPNDGRFTVSYYNNGGNNTQRRIIITDAKGARVYDRIFPISGPYTLLSIDLRAASRGIYFVSVGDASGMKLAEGKVHVR